MDLYDKTILELNRNPRNYSAREAAEHVVKAYNTFCGDKYKVHLDFADRAEAVSFMGYGCAVSKASTSIMTDCIDGKAWQEIHDSCVFVLDFLKGENEVTIGSNRAIADIDVRLQSFDIVHKYPGRLDCAALCWEEMRKYAILQLT